MNKFETALHDTQSVCPVCLQIIPARNKLVGGDIYLQKTCAENGDFSTVIWRGQEEPSYHS